ncbi:MAG: hypothetical protein OXU81_02395 [Gammaproteobacteria bacterium]|nr:hypothetical protein [Gammaproteobacteria bacterium]
MRVAIPRAAAEMVATHVRNRLAAERGLFSDRPEASEREVSAARAKFLAELVERALGYEAQHPVAVEVLAPAMGDAEDLRMVAEWQEAQERRLTAEAPAPVRAAIEANQVLRAARAGDMAALVRLSEADGGDDG